MMNIDDPIIISILQDDLYKFTMGAVVFHNFHNTIVTYEFFNRGQTQFPEGFAKKLEFQIKTLSQLKLTDDEETYLKGLPYMRPTFVEWLKGFRFNPEEVTVAQIGGDLKLSIKGPWYRTIFWEVKLMAIISELYFRMIGVKMADDWQDRIKNKATDLNINECSWSDFGTRRRFSGFVQDTVVSIMKDYNELFIGTSNPYLAKKYKVPVIGTSAHEAVMAMSALVGPKMANDTWMNYWSTYYKGQLGIALTDTFTTDVFLRDFTGEKARLWDGLRQDSGNPFDWADKKIIPHYDKIGVPITNKKLIFSDNLNISKAINLNRRYYNIAIPIFGIGTFLSNDVFTEEQKKQGLKPLNMVIKLTSADFGEGFCPVVKLSDDQGKHTGKSETIDLVKKQLNIN